MRHLAFLALAFTVACSARVDVEDGGGGGSDECGPPPPPAACGGDWSCVNGEWVSGFAECECPPNLPVSGSACDSVGLSCPYQDEAPCGPITTVTATCDESGWRVMYPTCQPEPTCPLDMPIPGSDCSAWEYPYFCQYNLSCGGETRYVSFDCDYQTDPPSWSPAALTSECGPCEAIGDPASCGVAAGCRWLEPGCGIEPIVAGCYAENDCAADSCDPTQTCVERTYDPCWLGGCDACGASAYVCQ